MEAGERRLEDIGKEMLNMDVLYEILCKVNGVTLCAMACSARVFIPISQNEQIWERICMLRWPSTRQQEIKSIIRSLGGFRKFYAQCFPLIINKQPFIFDVDNSGLKDAEDWFDEDEGDYLLEELSDTSPDDFISIIDVVFRGNSIGHKVLHGIPGSGDLHGWFSNCPFRIDSLNCNPNDRREGEGGGFMLIHEGLPTVVSIEKERKDGRLWRAVWDEIRVSWIIINRKTNEMANLASWRPMSGQRHWPSDEHFVFCFGSILPAHQSLMREVVRCNVVLKCKLLSDIREEESSSFLVTELSMQFEDMAGAHLNGRQSLLVLKEALNSKKSMDHEKVLNSYTDYIRAQSEFKEEKLRSQGRVDTMCIMCGIVSLVFLCYYWF